jgi:hypothetical protein
VGIGLPGGVDDLFIRGADPAVPDVVAHGGIESTLNFW